MKSNKIIFLALFSIAALFLSFILFSKNRSPVAEKPLSQNPSPEAKDYNSPEAKNIQKQRIAENYGKLPLHFEPNLGQSGDQVKFTARGSGYSLFLNENEAVLALEQKSENKRAIVKMKVEGAKASPDSIGIDETAGKSNYFIGNDPDKWRANVPNYEKVKYSGVYEGIDLVYYGNNQKLEYDFVVAPNADPNQIKLKFDGVKDAKIDEKTGDLLFETEVGEIRQHKPFSYQTIDGVQKEITSRYGVQSSDQNEFVVSFRLAKYDTTKELIIDPILVFGSYLGGSEADRGTGITIDSQGNAFVIGSGTSFNFPTTAGTIKPVLLPRSGTTNSFWSDAFVTKINPDGTAIVFSTYLGGRSAGETSGDIKVDDQGNVYVNGTTQSTDFPLVNAYRSTAAGPEDAFASKLNSTGSALIYSTFIGGNNTDTGSKIALNKTTGEATFVGRTSSPDFSTTPGALREKLCDSPQNCSGISYSGSYVARFSPDGTAQFVTLFDARLNDVALDQNHNSVIGGSAASASLITPDAYQPTSTGGGEGYLGKLNLAGNQVIYGTYLGGGLESDLVIGVALDSAQNILVTGQTQNAGFPTTTGAFDTTFNGSGTLADGFLTKFNANGSALIYSTFLGGAGRDEPKDIAVGSDDSAFIVGETTGASSFPLRNSIMNLGTMFLTHFNTNASDIVYSTILGPLQGQGGIYAVAVDSGGNAFMTGNARSVPVTPGAFQTANGANGTFNSDDAFILKVGPADENATYYSISGSISNQNNGTTAPVVVTISGTVNRILNIVGGSYFFGNLPAGGSYTVSVTVDGFEASPQAVTFNNLGANQFADFTILRNQKPVSIITTPAHHTNFDAPANINIQATASDPDAGDTISKIEFVAYKDGVNIQIGTDTTSPYEADWNNITETGTWAIYAYPFDNHGLRGDSTPTVHVFVNDPAPVSVSFVSPTQGENIEQNTNYQIEVNVSSSVTYVQIHDENGDLVTHRNTSPWVMNWWVDELGQKTLTATAFNAQGESVTSLPVTVNVTPINHRISGIIYHAITNEPMPNVTLNLIGPNSISAQTTTDQNGGYTFTDLGGSTDDTVIITPSLEGYTFNPANLSIWLAFIRHHENKNFSAVPITGITVQMTSPSSGQNFPRTPTINLAANASSDSNTITRVEFYVRHRGIYVITQEDTTAPYSYDWTNVPGGVYYLFARAYDNVGGIADSETISIFVASAPSVIRLQGDVENASGGYMQGITVRLTGTANGQTINQTSISNSFGAYGFFNLAIGGNYTITPEGSGGTTFTPTSFSITNATADQFDIDFQASTVNQSPSVVINNPSDGSVFTMPVSIQMTATATDVDGQIVHFAVSASGNGVFQTIGEVNHGNFNIPWQPNAPGEYTIFAIARDNGGLRTTETINITVNPPPPVSISGRIVNRDSIGIEGVDLTLDNTSDSTAEDTIVQTDVNGNYMIPNIATFNHYRLKASKLNYSFVPNYRNYFSIASNQTGGDFTGTLALQPADFDGDGETDMAVWRPSDGVWHVTRSNNGSYTSIQFGAESFGDVAVPGNYDGDEQIDVAVYRNGTWYIFKSSNGQVQTTQLGNATDKPTPGDYDGDGKTDIAVWRPSTGVWYILRSSDGIYDIRSFGLEGDIPLSADYDGDGKTDLTVWRPSSGVWYVLQSTDGSFRTYQFGANGDIPLVGDFDGDKNADFTIFRPSTGVWYVLQSSDNNFKILQWGIATDTPVPGDYDRDGKTDFAVFRKSEGNWYIFRSSDSSFAVRHFGSEGDVPLPSAYMFQYLN